MMRLAVLLGTANPMPTLPPAPPPGLGRAAAVAARRAALDAGPGAARPVGYVRGGGAARRGGVGARRRDK